MKKILFLLIFVFSFHFSSFANAETETKKACIEYVGTGKQYFVDATLTTGSELNEKTQSLNFNSLSNYIVVFWGPDQATLIETTSLCNTTFQCEGKDQKGYKWKVDWSPIIGCNN